VCGSVEKAGDSEFFGRPFGKGLPGRECIGDVRSRQWDEGDDVDDAEARVNAVSVATEIECLDGVAGQAANRLFANESEHASMVVGVDMEIENILAADRHQVVEHLGVPPLADVRHAFEHVFTLPGASRQS
jgi:hypothetical protein